MDLQRALFKNGVWQWDEVTNGLLFVSRDQNIPNQKMPSMTAMSSLSSRTTLNKQAAIEPNEIKFREVVDPLEQIRFRRYHQRRCKPTQPKVITIQDVKDIAIYMANYKDLSSEFLRYFHIPTMDRFLRALIIYFQYYLKVWEHLMHRRKEAQRKLYQPTIIAKENIIRDDLSDLRVMIAREYCSILAGGADAKKFHHMNNKNNESQSEKERRLFETLIPMAGRVVWIALQRKHLSLIELELNRLTRTSLFNIVARKRIKRADLKSTTAERRILTGLSSTAERKLLHRSSLAKELIIGDHDYRLFSIGYRQYEPTDDRMRYIEIAISAPEEILVKNGITVGMLGIPRGDYDAILMNMQFSTRKKLSGKERVFPEFKLPPKVTPKDSDMPKTVPQQRSVYSDTPQKIQDRTTQCKMWVKASKKIYEGRDFSILDLSLSHSHVMIESAKSSTSFMPKMT